MVPPCPVGILAELHVQHPVLAVLDPPVPAHGLRETLQADERAQVVAAFHRGLVPDHAGRLHPPDGRQPRPFRLLLQPADVAAEAVAPRLDPPVALFHGFVNRQRPLCIFRVQPQAK